MDLTDPSRRLPDGPQDTSASAKPPGLRHSSNDHGVGSPGVPLGPRVSGHSIDLSGPEPSTLHVESPVDDPPQPEVHRSEPLPAEPLVTEPDLTEPAVTEPDATQPDGLPLLSALPDLREEAGDGPPMAYDVAEPVAEEWAGPGGARRTGRRGALLHWITGFEHYEGGSRPEALLYSALGFAVVVTVGLATVSATLVIRSVAPGWPWPVLLLCVAGWATVVLMVELLIVRQIHFSWQGRGRWAAIGGAALTFVIFLCRLTLAVTVAYLVAEPAITYLFNDKVEEQRRRDHQAKVDEFRTNVLATGLAQWQRRENATVETLRSRIAAAQKAHDYWRTQVKREYEGKGDCGAGQEGIGDCYVRAEKALKLADGRADKAQSACQEALDRARVGLTAAEADAGRAADKFGRALERNSGIFDRMTALTNIERYRHAQPPGGADADPPRGEAVSRATVLPSCDPEEDLPTSAELQDYVRARASLSVAGGERDGVTTEEASFIFRRHLMLLALLVLVDLFPLLTKQLLRFSPYAQRTKDEATTQVALSHSASQQVAAQASGLVEVAWSESQARASHAERVLRAELEAELAELEREQARRRDREALEHEAEMNGIQRRIDHDAEAEALRNAVAIRRYRSELGLAEVFETRYEDVPPETLEAPELDRMTHWRPASGILINGRWRLIEPMDPSASRYAQLWRASDVRPELVRVGQLVPHLGDVVVKFLPAGADDVYRREKEVLQILQNASLEHVAPVLDVGSIPERFDAPDGRIEFHYVVQPFYEKGNLQEYLERRTPTLQFCVGLARQLLTGLQRVHTLRERPLLHLDIKPMNVVMAELPVPRGRPGYAAFIIDWGISTKVDRTTAYTGRPPGTQFYGAPEQWLRDETDDARGEASDVYGVAATLYWVCTGSLPLQAEYLERGGERISWHAFLRERPTPTPMHQHAPQIPRQLSDLVQRWLAPLPEYRVRPAADGELDPGVAGRALLELDEVERQIAEHFGVRVGRRHTPNGGTTKFDERPGPDME